MVHMGHQCRTLAPQVGAAASEGASRTHGSGRDRGLREHAATEQAGHLWGIALRVFGFATVQSLHREGMPQDTGHALLCTELSQPVPGTHTRDGHDEPLAVWGDGLEQGFRRGLPSALQQAFASMVQDTDGHAPRVQINTAVKWVWVGIALHEVFSSVVSDLFPSSAYHRGK